MTDLLEAYKKARELIAVPGNWVQNDLMLDRNGKQCRYRPQDACRWCAAGVLVYVLDLAMTGEGWAEAIPFGPLGSVTGAASIIRWNDDPQRTHAEVVRAFDDAIALLSAQQP